MGILFTIGSFIVALAILIAVHEFGHYWVARRLGVKVLRFSIGFGKALLRWRRHPDGTEYVIAMIPLGGYVKMLDEREEDVPEELLGQSFNRQPLWKRSAIVLAGPIFNLLFAIFAYWAIFMAGDTGLKPVIGTVEPATIAAEAGFRPGDELLAVGTRTTQSWESAAFAFTVEALNGKDLAVRVREEGGQEHDRLMSGDALGALSETPDLLDQIGLTPRRPSIPPVIGEIVAGESAEHAGLRVGDRMIAADGTPIESWRDWVALVRERPGEDILVDVERDGRLLTDIVITPGTREVDGEQIGRIGAGVYIADDLMADYLVDVRYGPIDAMGQAIGKTVEMSGLMLRVMGRMLIGEASVHNLSGPITIAEAAGRTASYGFDSFVKFLAIISISLGILNLLPIPVLDGGHLLFFLIEWIKGSPLSDHAQIQGQKVGFLLLAALMTLAFYVDLSRLLG